MEREQLEAYLDALIDLVREEQWEWERGGPTQAKQRTKDIQAQKEIIISRVLDSQVSEAQKP